MKIITFLLNEERCAMPMTDISEVNRTAGIRIVPKAPDYVLGLINLHGAIVPILNLKRVLRIAPWQLAPDSMWIAVKHQSALVCLAVDKIGRIIEVPRQAIDEAPMLSKGPETKYLKCCARIDGAIVPVLAVDNLLNEKESEVLAEIMNSVNGDR
jgi:purine-binding chemotaxis protein CheW